MTFKTTAWNFLNKLDSTQNRKLRELIDELKSLHFTCDSELSTYIVDSKIGEDKYRILGAELILSDGITEPKLGGFSQEIYAYLCRELGLKRNESDFKVLSETPYSENLK
ncbi:hypothetical protein [Acinetobacter sp. ANC 4648]|uniref:hypothetical protein n=1 Tax=Acinetobacter sp. ANC 4648 TaxID=1977875 RepID=UPI000A347E81|nr:hypothetical protein [Acinetobacter sp. ANC 4648]OTG79365.1 hypothetical protein B9T27_14570 [Acinetobacter sp. ANC 4648]